MDYEYLVNTIKSFNIKNLLLEILDSDGIWEKINDIIKDDPENLPEDFNLNDLDSSDNLTYYIIETLKNAVNKYDKQR